MQSFIVPNGLRAATRRAFWCAAVLGATGLIHAPASAAYCGPAADVSAVSRTALADARLLHLNVQPNDIYSISIAAPYAKSSQPAGRNDQLVLHQIRFRLEAIRRHGGPGRRAQAGCIRRQLRVVQKPAFREPRRQRLTARGGLLLLFRAVLDGELPAVAVRIVKPQPEVRRPGSFGPISSPGSSSATPALRRSLSAELSARIDVRWNDMWPNAAGAGRPRCKAIVTASLPTATPSSKSNWCFKPEVTDPPARADLRVANRETEVADRSEFPRHVSNRSTARSDAAGSGQPRRRNRTGTLQAPRQRDEDHAEDDRVRADQPHPGQQSGQRQQHEGDA